jgi:predicted RNA-binding protein with PUA-like domain
MSESHWLVKQEPADYSWSNLVRDRQTAWTGVRNFQARHHLRAMRKGDLVALYHSGKERRLVGLATVSRTAYPDPTAPEGDWVAVDLQPLRPLHHPISLAEIKADPQLRNLALVRQPRLSVMALQPAQFHRLLALAQTDLDSPPKTTTFAPECGDSLHDSGRHF